MSGKVVGMVFDHYQASGGELLLAIKLADNAADDGTHIFPSVATLASQTRQSERAVQYQIKRMLAIHWLVLVREARGGGRSCEPGRPREYRIDPVWIKSHDSRTPEAERPVWTPATEANTYPARKQMGAETAPISSVDNFGPAKEMGAVAAAEMGAVATAEMGAVATAPYPSLTVMNKEKDAHAPEAPAASSVVAGSENLKQPQSPRPDGTAQPGHPADQQKQRGWVQAVTGAATAPARQTDPGRPQAPRSEDRNNTRGAHLLPDSWHPQPADVQRLSAEVSWPAADIEQRYAEAFKDIARAKGYAYRDWHAAFRNCVRQDWPGFRGGLPPSRRDANTGPPPAIDAAERTRQMLAQRDERTGPMPADVRAKLAMARELVC